MLDLFSKIVKEVGDENILLCFLLEVKMEIKNSGSKQALM
jgi:hypothetical protein